MRQRAGRASSGPQPLRGVRFAGMAVVAAALLAFGCADAGSPDSAAGDPPPASGSDRGGMSEAELAGIDPDNVDLALDWTTNRVIAESEEGETPARIVTSVSFSTVPGADRMVVEFEEAAPLPSHAVESFIRPVPRCEGADSIRSQGPGLLRIRLPDASADSAVAAPPFPVSGLGNVTMLHLACLQEAVVEWVLDVRDATAYRVLHLSNPTRLVVDVRQTSPDADAGSGGG